MVCGLSNTWCGFNFNPFLPHQTCFSGGMFALGAVHATNGQTDHYMDLARGVANVCHESYQGTGTGVQLHVCVYLSLCVCK